MTIHLWIKRASVVAALALVLMLGTSLDNAQPAPASAQSGTSCDELVTQALSIAANVCVNIGANEVCYANPAVSVTLNDPSLFFDRPGDIVPVTAISELNTGSIDPENNEWGIVLMDLSADLPATSDPVRVILFGGAQLEPAVDDPTTALPTCRFVNGTPNAVNFRSQPNPTASVTDVLNTGNHVQVYGQTADGAWLRSSRGWIAAAQGALACNGVALQTMDGSSDAFVAPMQAFTLTVSASAQCESVPTGMLIQTPTGQTASLLVNNVEMHVGSTAVIAFEPDTGCQTVGSMQGNVDISSAGAPVPVGGQVRVGTGQRGDNCYESYRPNATTIDPDLLAIGSRLTNELPTLNTVEVEAWEATAPSVLFTADGQTGDHVFEPETCVYLDWDVSDAAVVTLNGSTVGHTGYRLVCPTTPTTYILSAIPLNQELAAATSTVRLIPAGNADSDRDGVRDVNDNCPGLFNPAQSDADGDGVGNACADLYGYDADDDSIEDFYDNCPDVANPDQADSDGDGWGDACPDFGYDSDDDGIDDAYDNCPYTFNPDQVDDDFDGFGDDCSVEFSDDDFDGDGIADVEDTCPFSFNPGQAVDFCEEEDWEGIEEYYDDLWVGDEDAEWEYEWDEVFYEYDSGDESTDDELTDDELTDDELTDDELTDDELTDDELTDDDGFQG